MAYLKEFPVNELKIDRSFVSQMATSPSDAVIVRSTIDLGHNLGLRVVAEGVETQHAWQQLSALGCDIAQGYYLGRAIPAAELEQQLTQLPKALVEIQADPRTIGLTRPGRDRRHFNGSSACSKPLEATGDQSGCDRSQPRPWSGVGLRGPGAGCQGSCTG